MREGAMTRPRQAHNATLLLRLAHDWVIEPYSDSNAIRRCSGRFRAAKVVYR